MSSRPPINQLDPFADEKEFQTKEIRHSRSRTSRNFFFNFINHEDKIIRRRNRIILSSLLAGAVLITLAVIFIPKLSTPTPSQTPESQVNPTGRAAASSEDIPALDDPEARAYEQEKLNTVLALLDQNNWEYTNALFETIFPDYLDACGKYDYYRAAVVLSKNFEGFSIPHDEASARAEELFRGCKREDDIKQPEQPAQPEQSEQSEQSAQPEQPEQEETSD